eukprot:376708_1
MPFVVQLACSDRQICLVCTKSIKTHQLCIADTKQFHITSYHLKCFKKHFTIKEIWIHKFRGHELITGENKEKFNEMISYFTCKRAQKKLKKHIYQMNKKEIKKELCKRGLVQTGNFSQLQNRLRGYMQSELCIKYQKIGNEKLVFGYHRRKEKKYALKMPKYLVKLTVSFFPLTII